MAVNLKKGQKVSLVKSDGKKLTKLMVGLGWDAAVQEGGFFKKLFSGTKDIDCDASVFLCKGGKLRDKDDIVYFGNLQHYSNSVKHMLDKIPADYDKLVFVVNIYQAVDRKQHFGMIKNAFIRIVDNDTNEELCRYNLSDNYDNMLAMVAGEVYKKNGEWKFNAIGNGTTDPGLSELSKRFS